MTEALAQERTRMTPRENLLSLIRRNGYEQAPAFFELCPHLQDVFRARAAADGRSGLTVEAYFGEDLFPLALLEAIEPDPREGLDWRRYFPDGVKPGTTFDPEYGFGHEPGSDAAMHMTRLRHPMRGFESLEEMLAYPWPSWEGADWRGAAREVEAMHARGKAVYCFMPLTVWEVAWYLRGMEELMADMMEESPMAEFLLDKVTEGACRRVAHYARAGADFIHLGDDVGMQSRLMMSPELYRAWLKPRLATVIGAAKAEKPDIVVDYHSCGYVTPLIAEFIEAGIDVLSPVQPESMDFADIHRDFGGALSFRGTIGTQTTMPFGTPEEVKRTTWRNLDIAGPGGGLFATPTHLLEPEVPWENIVAYVEACREYGRAGR